MIAAAAQAASTTQTRTAPPTPPAHGIVAWLPEPSSRAVSSMTAVPQEAARASCRPSHGISHETARLARPANVAKPTNGATIRFAGMENTGSSGSMSTWIGRVNTCAAMVMDRASATNRGRTGSIHALRVSANSTMPSTAAQDRANPKLCDMCGHAISIANVVQLNDAIAWPRLPMNRHAAPDNPIKSARDTESDGNTHADSMMYDMATSSAVNRRGRRKNEQTERTNAAVTARWPPLTAMRCTIPDLWNASSTCAAYVESMSAPSPSAGT